MEGAWGGGGRTGLRADFDARAKKERSWARVCLRRACARLRMSLVTPPGDPGIRFHHTGLSTPTTVRTGLHYAFSNDPGCTTLSQIIVATDTVLWRHFPYVLSRVAEVMAGYVAAELFLALPRLGEGRGGGEVR